MLKKNKKTLLEPYTSVKVSSLRKTGELLRNILSSKTKTPSTKITKPVVLYGAGSLGKMAKDFFDSLGLSFLYVVDKNAGLYKKDAHWKGIGVIRPDEVREVDKNNCLLVICIVTVPVVPLRDSLRNSGWKDVAFFYDMAQTYSDRHPLNNGWFVNGLKKEEEANIKKVFSLLYDDVSRAHYVQFLAWRKTRVELLFSGIHINNDSRFFIPEISRTFGRNEVFVDCGAHDGSVSEKFSKIIKNKYEAIYAIEPDQTNFKALEKRFAGNSRVKAIRCALSNKESKEKFYEGFGFASRLDDKGKGSAKTIRLDSLNIKATFIKMHLEGKELSALKGAMETLRKFRPIVAATIYHNSDGIFKTPLFFMERMKKYRYYVRLHSWAGTGAVFYAVPEERFDKI